MSHIVSIATRVRNSVAVAAACQRLRLPAPVQGTAKLYSGEVTGLLVELPGWKYPAVIDTASGAVQYDAFGGHWGEESHLQKFLQAYAIEVVRLEARRKGFAVTETQMQDGSVRLQVQEGQT